MNLRPFDTLPPLSKSDALKILKTPLNQIKLSSDYYKAVFHLSKYPSVETENVLLNLVRSTSQHNSILLAKRKAIEVLGRMRSKKALHDIGVHLQSNDPYIVENSAWALQEIGCTDRKLHGLIGTLLDKPNQNHRVLIQSLAKMGAISELPKIQEISDQKEVASGVKGAAIAAISNLTGQSKDLALLREYLDLPNQNDRQFAVQDIIDAKAFDLLGIVVKTPVSPFFRLRAIDLLYPKLEEGIELKIVLDFIDSLIIDDPRNIRLLYTYKSKPDADFLVKELFRTDFNHSFLALKTLISMNNIDIWNTLEANWKQLKKDYGALYFVLILFRHLDSSSPKINEKIMSLIRYSLDKSWPEFMKFRPQAIFSSIYIDLDFFESNLANWLDEKKTPYWVCRYAALMGIDKIINSNQGLKNLDTLKLMANDTNRFIRLKADNVLSSLENEI